MRTWLLAGAVALAAGVAAAQGYGGGGMDTGAVWTGQECCGWEFTWVKRPRGTFAGAWRHPGGERLLADDIVITPLGAGRVRITRQGGSNAGGCTYEGTIRRDGASGTYACRGSPAGTWFATIE